MAWILTIDVAGTAGDVEADTEAITERLWALGTNGVALVPASDGRGAAERSALLAGFDSEPDAVVARDELGGSIAPVDETAWSTPDVATIEIAGRTLTIDAGRSFGHGAHPTTRLCLAALTEHLRTEQSVLDVGSGSGVLSLAAAALGARSVTAIDIDPLAIASTRANAAANGITIEVSTATIAELAGPFDVVVVNMLVAELAPIAADVRRLTGGLLIVSGALDEQREQLAGVLSPSTLVSDIREGEWIAQVHRIESEQ